MKLKWCAVGMIVKTKEGEVGFISGLAYDVTSREALRLLQNEGDKSKGEHTILEVTFPDSKRILHPSNIYKL